MCIRDRLELGTGDAGIGQIALYEKCGLRIVGIDPDYFTRFYPVPITENGTSEQTGKHINAFFLW